MEFDVGAEFNGEGLIANTWPEHILARARGLLKRPLAHTWGIGCTRETRRFGRPPP